MAERNVQYLLQTFSRLHCLQREGTLCDLVLISSDGAQFRVHTSVLAAASKSFYTLLLQKGYLKKIRLMNIDGTSLEMLIRFIYGEHLSADDELKTLTQAVKKLGMKDLFHFIGLSTSENDVDKSTTDFSPASVHYGNTTNNKTGAVVESTDKQAITANQIEGDSTVPSKGGDSDSAARSDNSAYIPVCIKSEPKSPEPWCDHTDDLIEDSAVKLEINNSENKNSGNYDNQTYEWLQQQEEASGRSDLGINKAESIGHCDTDSAALWASYQHKSELRPVGLFRNDSFPKSTNPVRKKDNTGKVAIDNSEKSTQSSHLQQTTCQPTTQPKDSANPDSANPDGANPESANPDSANPVVLLNISDNIPESTWKECCILPQPTITKQMSTSCEMPTNAADTKGGIVSMKTCAGSQGIRPLFVQKSKVDKDMQKKSQVTCKRVQVQLRPIDNRGNYAIFPATSDPANENLNPSDVQNCSSNNIDNRDNNIPEMTIQNPEKKECVSHDHSGTNKRHLEQEQPTYTTGQEQEQPTYTTGQQTPATASQVPSSLQPTSVQPLCSIAGTTQNIVITTSGQMIAFPVQLPQGGAVQLPQGGAVQLPKGGAVQLPKGGAFQLPKGGAVQLPKGGAVDPHAHVPSVPYRQMPRKSVTEPKFKTVNKRTQGNSILPKSKDSLDLGSSKSRGDAKSPKNNRVSSQPVQDCASKRMKMSGKSVMGDNEQLSRTTWGSMTSSKSVEPADVPNECIDNENIEKHEKVAESEVKIWKRISSDHEVLRKCSSRTGAEAMTSSESEKAMDVPKECNDNKEVVKPDEVAIPDEVEKSEVVAKIRKRRYSKRAKCKKYSSKELRSEENELTADIGEDSNEFLIIDLDNSAMDDDFSSVEWPSTDSEKTDDDSLDKPVENTAGTNSDRKLRSASPAGPDCSSHENQSLAIKKHLLTFINSKMKNKFHAVKTELDFFHDQPELSKRPRTVKDMLIDKKLGLATSISRPMLRPRASVTDKTPPTSLTSSGSLPRTTPPRLLPRTTPLGPPINLAPSRPLPRTTPPRLLPRTIRSGPLTSLAPSRPLPNTVSSGTPANTTPSGGPSQASPVFPSNSLWIRLPGGGTQRVIIEGDNLQQASSVSSAVQPSAVPIQSSVQPSAVQIQPSVQPSAVPIQPSVQPSAVPIQPSVQPSAVQIQPSSVAVRPSAVQIQPSAVAIQPDAVPIQPDAVRPSPVPIQSSAVQPPVVAVRPSAIAIQPRVANTSSQVVMRLSTVSPMTRYVAPAGLSGTPTGLSGAPAGLGGNPVVSGLPAGRSQMLMPNYVVNQPGSQPIRTVAPGNGQFPGQQVILAPGPNQLVHVSLPQLPITGTDPGYRFV